MKRLALIFLFLIGLLNPAFAADRYWVGGTGNWSDNTNHWSATDGGAPGASLPTSSDNVFFTAASSGAAYAVTADTTVNCLDMTWALPGAGVPTFQGTSQIVNVYGSLTLVATMVVSFSGSTMQFLATATGKTITTAGVAPTLNLTFSGSGGGWTLADALTLASARTITITAGTLDTNGQTVTTGFFVSTSGTRALNITNSTINLAGTSGNIWNATGAGMTFTNTGSTVNFSGGAAGVALTISCSATPFETVNITGPGLWTFNTSFTAKFFNYTSTTNKTDKLVLSATNTISANGSLTIAGNSSVNRAFVVSNTLGTQKQTSVPSTATVTLTNVDFQDMAATGTYGTWTGTSLGDCLGNSGITFDASTTQTFNGTNATDLWSTAARWTSRVPLPQDDVVIPAMAGGSQIVSSDMPRLGRNIDASANSKVWSFSATPNTIFGNITIGASGTYSGTQALTLAGRGSHTITSNGKTFPQAVTVAAFGGTYTLQDAFVVTGTITFTNGIFADGGNTVQCAIFTNNGALTRSLNATGIWSVTQANSTTPWNVSASLTVISMPSLIQYTGATTVTTTFGGGGFTYNNFYWASTSATGILTITGANTFADFKIDGTTARTVTFPASTVTTINTLTQSNATAGVLTTINSSTGGTQATLQSRGPRQSLHFLSVIDIKAVGGAGWFAGNSSTNGGNNYGFQFRAPAPVSSLIRRHRASNDNLALEMVA